MNTIHFIPVLIGQFQMCHSPNPLEWTIIIATVGGILILSGVGAAGIASVAGMLVPMLVSGASIEAITASITAAFQTITTIGASLEVVAQLVYAVKVILGC